MIPKIGDQFTFVPTAYNNSNGSPTSIEDRKKNTVLGTVRSIHRRHGWYRVSYETPYFGIQYECFQFYGGGTPGYA